MNTKGFFRALLMLLLALPAAGAWAQAGPQLLFNHAPFRADLGVSVRHTDSLATLEAVEDGHVCQLRYTLARGRRALASSVSTGSVRLGQMFRYAQPGDRLIIEVLPKDAADWKNAHIFTIPLVE
jgi:hypothetical protein